MTPEDILDVFRASHALREGHFELRSGLHSDAFFQCALVLQYPDRAARLCAELVATSGCPQPDVVMAPALGGITIGYELGRQFGVRSIFAEKEEGRLVLRRGFEIRPGERVVVAEDVVTRRGRVQEVVDIVEERGGHIAGVLVLVDRSGGQARFDYPLHALIHVTPKVWTPEECPLCRAGQPIEHPGS